ncbi:hypothetical protein NOVOSPHI9U_210021 [Novosphingobium sp. 9U]|nr:hypothetical protein NOVOSPHI9U_210021 [Novosphingobium sp. 9U]
MYWASALLGTVLVAAAIQLYDVLPRPRRVVIGLVGTVLLIIGVFWL